MKKKQLRIYEKRTEQGGFTNFYLAISLIGIFGGLVLKKMGYGTLAGITAITGLIAMIAMAIEPGRGKVIYKPTDRYIIKEE